MEYRKPTGGAKLLTAELDTARVQLKTIRTTPTVTIRGPESVVKFVREMQDYDRERFKVIYLDIKNRVIGVENIAEGTINSTLIHPREAVKGSLLANASGVIFAHNHPSGIPGPSREDIDITEKLQRAFKLMGIDVLDSIIIGQEGYYSFEEQGELHILRETGDRFMDDNIGKNEACDNAVKAAMSVIGEQCGEGQYIDIEGVKISVVPPEDVMLIMEEPLTEAQRITAIQETTWAQNEAQGLCEKLFGIAPGEEGYAGCIQRVSLRLAQGVIRKK